MALEFQPPPQSLIDAYLNRPSGIQQADQNVHDLMAAYVQAQHEKSKSQTEAIGTLSKLADNVDFSDPNTIKAFGGLFKEAGIKSDVFNPSTPPTPSTGTIPSPIIPTPVEQVANQSLSTEHPVLPGVSTASPLIQVSLQHPDHQMAFGIGGLDPNQLLKTGGGRKKLAAAESALRYQNAMDERNAKSQPQTVMTKEAALKAGTVSPMTRIVEPPTPSTSDQNVTFIGNDSGGNPLFADKHGKITRGTVPTGGPVLPKTSTMPTASTRASAEFADTILPHINNMRSLVSEADQKGFIGPAAGRVYGKFLAGQVGSTGNPEADRILGQLRATDSLLKTGALRVHFGARGGQQMYEHFSELLNTGKQSAAMLNGSLDALQSFMEGYSNAGKVGRGMSAPISGATQKIGRFTVEVK